MCSMPVHNNMIVVCLNTHASQGTMVCFFEINEFCGRWNAWLLLSFKHVFFTATGNYQCSCWILRCSVHIIQCRGLRFRSRKSYVSPGDLIQYTVQGQKDTMKISMSYHNLYHKQYHHSSYLRNSNCGENYDRDEPT